MAQKNLNPLAQTFNVDSEKFPAGFFLHSVDLWFSSRDNSVPLKVQVRPVVNGYPHANQVVPFSDVLVKPHRITITETPSLSNATNIKFPTPPYLTPNEYALVILADSNKYELFISRMGEFVLSQTTGLATQSVISAQPFSGVLFKASNSSTFLPIPEEDLMFKINRCKFKTGTFNALLNTQFDDDQTEKLAASPISKQNTIHFNHDSTGNAGKFTYNAFRVNALEVKDSKTVTQPTYQYLDRIMTDEVTGASAGSTSYKDLEVNKTVYRDKLSDDAISSPDNRTGTGIVEEDQPNSFNIKASFGLGDDIVSPIVDTQQMNAIFIQNVIDDVEINPTVDITIKDGGTGFAVNDELLVYNSDLGTVPALTNTTTTNAACQTGLKDGRETNPGKLVVSAISGVTLTGTVTVAAFKVGEAVTQVLSGTNATGTVTGTTGNSSGSGEIAVLANDGSPAFKAISGTHTEVITGTTSGAKLGASNSAITLDSNEGAISTLSHPTSANDANRPRKLTGAISIGSTSITDGTATNALLQLSDELDPSGGIAESRYITKAMTLKEGFESEDIKVLINAVRPKGTQIYVYYKIKSAEDTEGFDTRPYNRLYELTNSDDVSQKESDVLPLEFVSYKKNSDGSIDQSTVGGTRYSSNGSNYEKFSEYAIKIVMASDSTNTVPLIDSMGALALIDPIQPAT